jgi:hypothetical protein
MRGAQSHGGVPGGGAYVTDPRYAVGTTGPSGASRLLLRRVYVPTIIQHSTVLMDPSKMWQSQKYLTRTTVTNRNLIREQIKFGQCFLMPFSSETFCLLVCCLKT